MSKIGLDLPEQGQGGFETHPYKYGNSWRDYDVLV